MSQFTDAFDQSLFAAERMMGETFTHKSLTYQAMSMDEMTSGLRVIAGGVLSDVSLVIYLSPAIANCANVQENDTIKARGKTFRVLTIGDDGTASRTLNCGPAGVSMPGF